MNAALVDGIVKAVLYEGYMLYPYRPSSVKNQQRFNFGVVYPRAYSEAQHGSDAWTMQTECLVKDHHDACCLVKVRFLRMVARSVARLRTPATELSAAEEANSENVDRLQIGGNTFHAWHEAVEEVIEIAEFHLAALASQSMQWPFRLSATQEREPLRDQSGPIVGFLQRDKNSVCGTIDLAAERVAPGLFKLRIHISNASRMGEAALLSREHALGLA